MLMLARDKIKTYRMEVIHCTVLKLTDNRHQLANLFDAVISEGSSFKGRPASTPARGSAQLRIHSCGVKY